MKFDELESSLRNFETAHDRVIPSGIQIVARLDGRGFSRLTKEVMDYEAPYDSRFRDAMLGTMKCLMRAGFKTRFAYAQSDEISLLFDPEDRLFARKHRKWLSILAGQASASLSLEIGRAVVMDCRIIELPDTKTVVDYFRWRMEDARRNCLNSHAYWVLRKEGATPSGATASLSGLSTSEKRELLLESGVSFDSLPAWQRIGYAVMNETFTKIGTNPVTGNDEEATRTRLVEQSDLPSGREYSEMIAALAAYSL